MTRTITVNVKVTAVGTVPTGRVSIFLGTTRVGTGMLVGGKVKILITKDLPVGKKVFTAKYLGSANVAPSSAKFTVTIVK